MGCKKSKNLLRMRSWVNKNSGDEAVVDSIWQKPKKQPILMFTYDHQKPDEVF
jgi:hypothetical protein